MITDFLSKNWAVAFVLILSLLFTACKNGSATSGNSVSDTINLEAEDPALEDDAEAEESQKSIIYRIPPVTGPGTGICEVYLKVEDKNLTAYETCGGHDENGRTESTSKLFSTGFRENHPYRVSELNGSGDDGNFGCRYFEFRDGKLYLLDESRKIMNEQFCVNGNTETDMSASQSCDCIFLSDEY
jgi:hypothetical protein